MIDSEEFGHGGPTVVQVLEDTWVALEVWSQRLAYQGELDGGFVAGGESLGACHDTVSGARLGQELRGATRPDS